MTRMLLAMVVAVSVLVSSAVAGEIGNQKISPQLAADEITFIYFSNPDLTGEPVGEVNYDCWRRKTQWGETTPYHAQESTRCDGGGTGSNLTCSGMPNMVCPGYVLQCVYYGICGQPPPP